MTIRIFNLGRMKKSAQFVINDGLSADDVAYEIHRAVKKMKGLMSRNYDCTWDPEKRKGGVYAGFRLVGEAEVVSP